MIIQEHQIQGSMGFARTGALVRVLLDGLPLAVCVHDEAGAIVDYNAQAVLLWGSVPPHGHSAGRNAGFQQLFSRDGAPIPQAASPVAHVIETSQAVLGAKIVGERPDGSFKSVLISVLPLSEHGAITGAISCFRDIPADNPNPLDEPHEWEMLSRLCGSLGHDLANLFQSIRLNVNLVERRAGEQPPEKPLEKPLRGMAQAADRGLMLTRQLLAYAGRQHLSCAPTDINRLLAGMAPSLGALAGPGVRLKLRPAAQLWPAHADADQVKQAVFNVVTNACEAMKGAGDITIATAFSTLPAESGVRVAGDYVLISIADSGPGMDRETLTSAFQPYFTTKKGAEAQGFGLSTTLGIMRQHRGDIQVDSRPDHGTRVTLSLPRSTAAETLPFRGMAEVEVAPMLGKTVLVVDDDAEVRGAAVDMLESYGFDVLFSASGHDALGLVGSARPIDLILADFRLGAMDGIELVRQVRIINPDIKAILMSGFGDVRNRVGAEDRITVLQKPLRAEELLRQVREALAAEAF